MRTLLAPAWCGRSSCTQSSDLSPDEGTWTRCVTLDIGSRRHSDSLRHFGNCSGSYSIEYMASRWEESRPRRGQRRETDRTPGNDIRVSPEDAARHRLRGFRVCRIGSNRAAALSWCSSVLQRPRIFCVLSPSSASIGCMKQLLRLRAHIYALRTKTPTFYSQAPVGSGGRAALVVAQRQRPVYARIGLTPGHQRQKLLPVKSGHSGVAARRRQLPYSIEYRRTSMASCPSSTALLAS